MQIQTNLILRGYACVLLGRSHLICCRRIENMALTPYEVNLIHKDAVLSSDMLIGSVSPKFLSAFYDHLLFQQSIGCITVLFTS